MNLVYLGALVVLLFVITYDPRTRISESYERKPSGCCENPDYRGRDPGQCKDAYYQGLQFGDMKYGCPTRTPKEYMGAIISN